MSKNAVQYELKDTVAVIRLDDGKVNALSPDLLAALNAALDRAESEARAVVLTGRPGRFSAGFDLSVMRQGRDALIPLVTTGGELALRLYGFPRPVVVACTGHAIAMGAFLILCGDYRFGTEGDFKIGFNEVMVGMPVPIFGIELARDRLASAYLTRATVSAEIFAPSVAAEAGFFDRVTSPDALLSEAMATAKRLGQLDLTAFAKTKARLRRDTIQRIRDTLKDDIERLASGE